MKYAQAAETSDSSTPNRLNWTKLALKPFVYGIMFGIGCYVGSVLIRSPLMTDLLAEAKLNAKK